MKKILIFLAFFVSVFFLFTKIDGNKNNKKEIDKSVKKITRKAVKLSERQKRILSILSTSTKVPMKSIESKIGEVNVRTLRRDLDKLQQLRLIKKLGSTKSAFYQKL